VSNQNSINRDKIVELVMAWLKSLRDDLRKNRKSYVPEIYETAIEAVNEVANADELRLFLRGANIDPNPSELFETAVGWAHERIMTRQHDGIISVPEETVIHEVLRDAAQNIIKTMTQ
jgi:hypothetical protein